MKHLHTLHLLASLICTTALFAQSPLAFSYQAVVRDPLSGQPMAAFSCDGRYILRSGVPLGTVVYEEQQSILTNDQGLFSAQIGNGTPIIGTISTIDWGSGPYFLEVALDLAGTGSFTSMGSQQLLSVPYALHAQRSNIPDGTEVGQIAHWDGTTWVVDSGLYVHQKRFGIGVTQPESPLGIATDASGRTFSVDHGNNENWFFGDKRLTGNAGGGGGGAGGLNIVEETSNGNQSRLFIQDSTGHVGIGTDDPPATLSIKSREQLKTYFETGDIPTQDDFSFRLTDSTGFSIEQGTPSSSVSRLFLQQGTGFVGIGTVDPEARVHVRGTSGGVGAVVWRVQNTASTANSGWSLGHLNDAAIERNGAFSIMENTTTGNERITLRAGGNVGINEPIPHATLHITRAVTDPNTSVSLNENTGIAVIGPITDNLAMDHRGIQARHGEYIGSTLNLTTADLNLQRLGGDVLIHGDALTVTDQAILTSEAKLGLGTITPTEKLHVNGAIVVGNTTTAAPAPGSIRFNGNHFETWSAGDWAIFNGTQWEKVDNTDHIYYNPGSEPRVGIGTSTPTASLHVASSDATQGNLVVARISNQGTTTSTSSNDHRVGLHISNTGLWGGDPLSKDIGLYVSAVSGQTSSSSNLAAVLNGNTVIGDLQSGSSLIGANGSNVLAIQNGTAPSSAPPGPNGTGDGGVQLWSASDVSGTSVFHLMNGDGNVITLAKQNPLFTPDNGPVNPIYDANTAAIISNMRTRINELESRLQALGLLQ